MLLILSGTAFVGAINYEFIGNAAHAGGALTGAAVALLTGSDRPPAEEPVLDVLGGERSPHWGLPPVHGQPAGNRAVRPAEPGARAAIIERQGD